MCVYMYLISSTKDSIDYYAHVKNSHFPID